MHSSDPIFIAAGFIATGLLIGFLGYMIKYQGKVNLLSGYDPNRVRNKEALSNWAGGHLIVLAVLQVLAGPLAFWSIAVAIGTFLVATLTLVIRMVMGVNRFTS